MANDKYAYDEELMRAGIRSYRAEEKAAAGTRRLSIVQAELQRHSAAEELAARELELRRVREHQPNRVELALQLVAEEFDLGREALLTGRTHDCSEPRHIAMLILYTRLGLPLARLAEIFGHTSGGTVRHGIQKAQLRCAGNPVLSSRVQRIAEQLAVTLGARKPVASVIPASAAERIA